ncbi:MAG: ribosome biogenesis GTPase Der [Zetaproteobacteria bacterium]|nr:MAG: ribosome biogenesis GTPase Der [Zetaproteobacteria bacterium]
MARVVAIVGRPNVGKSTLFNRLTGSRKAIEGDRPGVTVDRIESRCRITPTCSVLLVDTGGIGEGGDHLLGRRMDARPDAAHIIQSAIEGQVEAALEVADLVLFVVDGRSGPCAADHEIAGRLRSAAVRLLLVVNKAERSDAGWEFHALGLGEPLPVSAIHGRGIERLRERIAAALSVLPSEEAADEVHEEEASAAITVVGRPNVGKSTLINRWLGHARMVVSPVAGTTRDAVDHMLPWKGGKIRLVDTAGVRKRARVRDAVEWVARIKAEQACARADAAVLLLDGSTGVAEQDLRLMQMARAQGCALVVAVNKIDLLDREGWRRYSDRLDFRMRGARGAVPRMRISAATGAGCDRLLAEAVAAAERNRFEAGTGALNRWLEMVQRQQHAPSDRGSVVRMKYITQVGTRPPTLKLFCNRPATLKESYLRFLEQSFRDHFALPGVPVRFILSATTNPYVEQRR